ncbi:MAG TPA: hypothetical protein VH083_27720 [Myxococcales bacterium]|jgi:hypothetical protein|nr:hypothetical protein [Myxococcales bacterium]
MLRDALLGLVAGAALATLPGSATWLTALCGALLGAGAGIVLSRPARRPGKNRGLRLLLAAFFVPALYFAVAPGADMAMHVALARGLLHGELSPAFPGVTVAAYPRGFSAVVALLSPLGLARAGLVAAGASYLIFYIGLAALVPWEAALVAVFLSRTPQIFFDWGGNPTALALGLGFAGAAAVRDRRGLTALLLFAGAAATHPMAACAAALPALFEGGIARSFRALLAAAAGLGLVVLTLALFGPAVSPRELAWIRDYAAREEAVPLLHTFAVLGDPAAGLTALSALLLLWQRHFQPVLFALLAVLGCALLFALLPYAGLYPARFAPLLLLVVAPLWMRLPRGVLWLSLAAALPLHLRWYQTATPIATEADLEAISCVARTVPKNAVVDGAYGDATQWIPALTGLAITRPHQHVSLFDETDNALARLPPAAWRFKGERLRYPPPLVPPASSSARLCNGTLLKLSP